MTSPFAAFTHQAWDLTAPFAPVRVRAPANLHEWHLERQYAIAPRALNFDLQPVAEDDEEAEAEAIAIALEITWGLAQ